MLYQWREAQRAFLQPLSDWALSASQMYANPYSPPVSYTHLTLPTIYSV